jgi:cyclohexadieny/prephenate dehydrogenase
MSKKTKKYLFNEVLIIGIGLIGSSIALSLKKNGIARNIVGFSKTEKTRKIAKKKRIVDETINRISNRISEMDLIIICSPLSTYEKIFNLINPHLSKKTIVTDVGSAKSRIVKNFHSSKDRVFDFIPAHPIAGTEQSGPNAGFHELFIDRWCIITPIPGNKKRNINTVKKMWKSMGSNIEIMTPERHDQTMAITSHLPHLIAYNIVSTAADIENVTKSDVIKYSASGFRDFTRIAASDPTMWRDVLLSNKDSLLEVISRFSEDLSMLQKAIRWEDGETLYKLFSKTRKIRNKIIDAGQDVSVPDFGRSKKK